MLKFSDSSRPYLCQIKIKQHWFYINSMDLTLFKEPKFIISQKHMQFIETRGIKRRINQW